MTAQFNEKQMGWPDHYDIVKDPIFHETIKPFIEEQLEALKAFDEKRAAWCKENMPSDYQLIYKFYEHTLRVADDVKNTALQMGLGDIVAENLYWATLPHDMGKKNLPVDLWDSMTKPTAEIKSMRRSHTIVGADIVREQMPTDHPFVQLMIDVMENHHEEMAGTGHLGLKGDELSNSVRLISIVESFDGYTIFRPHFGERDISTEGVLKRMREEKGAALYDMEYFSAFEEMKLDAIRHEAQLKASCQGKKVNCNAKI
jgi:HD-GYP domain-containing protein (c-di-GMP phosphodiesterase class II)